MKDLVKQARAAMQHAWAPYSNFHVGAAAITAYDPSYDSEGTIAGIAREIVATIGRGMV